MTLHPYDGQTRRFRDDDGSDRPIALAVLARIFGVDAQALPPETRWDLSFYSGGIGILDNLAISLPVTHSELPEILSRLHMRDCATALGDEYIRWMLQIRDDENPDGEPVEIAVPRFVAEHRAAFQPQLASPSDLWIADGSGVNSWEVAWWVDGTLAYLAFDQG